MLSVIDATACYDYILGNSSMLSYHGFSADNKQTSRKFVKLCSMLVRAYLFSEITKNQI